MKHTLAALAVVTGFASLSQAAGPAPVPQGLLACEQIQDSAERVRCYDNQVEALKKAAAKASTTKAATPSAAASGTASPAPTAARASGMPSAAPSASIQPPAVKFGQEDLPVAKQPPRAPKRDRYLHATLSSVQNIGPDIYLFTLNNGQVWKQNFSNGLPTARFFRTGDEVRIEKTTLGAYQLSVPRLGTKNWVLVTRVR